MRAHAVIARSYARNADARGRKRSLSDDQRAKTATRYREWQKTLAETTVSERFLPRSCHQPSHNKKDPAATRGLSNEA